MTLLTTITFARFAYGASRTSWRERLRNCASDVESSASALVLPNDPKPPVRRDCRAPAYMRVPAFRLRRDHLRDRARRQRSSIGEPHEVAPRVGLAGLPRARGVFLAYFVFPILDDDQDVGRRVEGHLPPAIA
jgi:hypothetical protein